MKLKQTKKISALLLSVLMTVVMMPALPGAVKVAEAASVAVDAENFPDDSFRKYVSEHIDKDGSKDLSDTEISSVAEIDVSDSGIEDLKGIEKFPELKRLVCSDNKLKSIDVGSNAKLNGLFCDGNGLKELDLANLSQLYRLDCGGNELEKLDIAKNEHLVSLKCDRNRLKELDLSGHYELGSVNCEANELTKLNLGGYYLRQMNSLDCSDNKLDWIYVKTLKNIKELDVSNNRFGSLDLVKNTELESLDCSGNQMTYISNLAVCKNLRTLNCANNELNRLDVSGNAELVNLYCYNNMLLTLDLSGNNELENAEVSYQKRTKVLRRADGKFVLEAGELSGVDAGRIVRASAHNGTFEDGKFIFDSPLSNNAFAEYSYDTGSKNGIEMGVRLAVSAAPQIVTEELPGGRAAEKYSTALAADVRGCDWRISRGELPEGLGFNDETGEISGTPVAAGLYRFSARACRIEESPEKEFTIAVSPVIVTPAKLPVGCENEKYETALEAKGFEGQTGVKWSLADGALPEGLSVDEETGRIAGTPAKEGEYKFAVRVEKDGVSDTKEFTLAVGAAAVVPDPGTSEENIKIDIGRIETTPGEKDPAGSLFRMLRLRYTKTTSKSIAMKWQKTTGAKTYVVMAGLCGGRYKELKRTTKTSLKTARAAGKKLKKGRYCKFIVAAYDKDGKRVAVSKTIHVVTKGGKYGNYKSVKFRNVKKGRKTLRTGKKFRIKARAVKTSKKLKARRHRGMRFESSNPKVAAVTKTGTVTARAKGKCTIYAYAQDGTFARATLTVK
ncbi:MAG: putative Ig domain-containing protein [Anaerovoracaceae bacterium]|jgi:Leucine-rich repeat (LRR) protein